MASIYTSSLATEETVFAELCLDTSDIVLDEPHIIDIISDTDSSQNGGTNFRPVPITITNFERMFYGQQTDQQTASPSFDASFQLTGSGEPAIRYYQLDRVAADDRSPGAAEQGDTVYSLMDGNGNPTNYSVNLIKPVTDFWVKDTGYALDCWSTCSYMSIAKEIDATHNLQNLDCNVCCSLCYGELLGLLDAKQPMGGETDKDETRKRIRVEPGDLVGLRVLYKNAFEGAKNVEVRIHYRIIANEPEPELADFEVQSSSNIDENTGVITFDVKNIGMIDATGYTEYDYHRIFEVTTDPNDANKLENLPADSAFHFIQDGVFHTYYQKALVSGVELSNNMPEFSHDSISGTIYTLSTSTPSKYLKNTPPLKTGDSISFKFTGNFEIGKTYMVCVDAPLYYSSWPTTADTEEIIDDAANPSNNYFVFTYNNLSE